MARGTSRVTGALTSLDARSSARVLRQLGARISPLRPGHALSVEGRGRLRRPDRRARLRQLRHDHPAPARPPRGPALPRDAHGRPVASPPADATGDGAARPDGRALHGAAAATGCRSRFRAATWFRSATSCRSRALRSKARCCSPALAGKVEVELREPHGRSRDHTERMLRAFGYRVVDAEGWIRFAPTGRIEPFELARSRATRLRRRSWWAPRSWRMAGELRIAEVGVNPTRIGFLAVLERMGAAVRIEAPRRPVRRAGGRPDRDARSAARHRGGGGRDPGADRRDPAAGRRCRARDRQRRCSGQVGELRVKESDRLELIAENLRSVGGARGDRRRRSPCRGRTRAAPRAGAHRGRPSPGDGVRRARDRPGRADPGGRHGLRRRQLSAVSRDAPWADPRRGGA